jgi:Uma2 family endonuclease
MATVAPDFSTSVWTLSDETLDDLHAHLGRVPLERIRLKPPPGEATEQDVVDLEVHTDRLYELIDGTLVEKAMGWIESILASMVIRLLGNFVDSHKLGVVAGAGGMLRILPSQVRIPDVSFISWERLPGRRLPRQPVAALAPDLAIEVLSKGNTKAEMERKLHDYFTAGVRLVWYIDPATRSARAFTAEDRIVEVDENGSLSGGEVLPGFELSLRELFAMMEGPA